MLKCFLFSDLIPKMTLILLLLSKSLFFYIIDTTLKCLPFCSLPSELGVRGPRKGFLTVSHSPHLFLYPSLLRPGLGLCRLLFRCTLPWHAGDAIAMNVSGALHIPGTAEMPASSDSLCGPPCSENSNKRTRLVRRPSLKGVAVLSLTLQS